MIGRKEKRMTISARIARSKTQGTSPGQRAVVAAIRRARKRHPHYGPSVRELADDMCVATTDVWQKLARLRRDGLVAWENGIPRTIRVVEGNAKKATARRLLADR